MRPSYARAIPRPWRQTAGIFVALGDPHRQRTLLMFEPGERLIHQRDLLPEGFRLDRVSEALPRQHILIFKRKD